MKYELVELRVKEGFVTEYLRELFRVNNQEVIGRSRPISDFTAEQLERIKKGELVWPPCEGSE